MITVYGTTWNSIIVDGSNALNGEFWTPQGISYLVFSDGTLLSHEYDIDQNSRIGVLSKGTSYISKDAFVQESGVGSDKIFLGKDVKWVVFGCEAQFLEQK